jgi:hypothetical protein
MSTTTIRFIMMSLVCGQHVAQVQTATATMIDLSVVQKELYNGGHGNHTGNADR